MNLNDTIAAISTPPGKGGVALIRISGDEALAVADKTFRPRSGKKLSEIKSRTAVYGDIMAHEPTGELVRIDDGIATVFRAPASYTGEDTVEICCHGGVLLTQTVLTALLTAGAVPAEELVPTNSFSAAIKEHLLRGGHVYGAAGFIPKY